MTEQTRLPFTALYNTRTLAGYITASGQQTSDRLLRGECFEKLLPADEQVLIDWQVRTVIDLRGQGERDAVPGQLSSRADVSYIAIALMNEDANIVDPDQAATFTMGDFYIYLLEQGQPAIAQVLRIIAQASDQPGRLLFHCAHGKDRTGVISALLLGLVGVADTDIVNDYAQTEQNISSIKKQIYELYGIAGQVDALIEEVFSSRPENMQKMLGFINEKYGGASGYIATIGLTEAERDAIARMMLS